MKHFDIQFGFAGGIATITLNQFNSIIACVVGLLTVGVMLLRLRREWKNRNVKTIKDGE